jgi:hypothetical protein
MTLRSSILLRLSAGAGATKGPSRAACPCLSEGPRDFSPNRDICIYGVVRPRSAYWTKRSSKGILHVLPGGTTPPAGLPWSGPPEFHRHPNVAKRGTIAKSQTCGVHVLPPCPDPRSKLDFLELKSLPCDRKNVRQDDDQSRRVEREDAPVEDRSWLYRADDREQGSICCGRLARRPAAARSFITPAFLHVGA